jgi:hypothetical protein
MSNICELISCEAIQQNLESAFGFNNMAPEGLRTLEYVLSPDNVAMAQVTAVTGRPSKTNSVKVIYDQRYLESEVEDGVAACVQTDTVCDFSQTYNFDTTLAKSKGFTIEAYELAGTCEENSALLSRKTAKLIELLDRSIAKKLAVAIAAQYGKWSVDTATGTGVTVAADILQVQPYLANGNPNPVIFQQIKRALEKSRISGGIVSGGDSLVDFFERSFTRGASDGGWDLQEMLNRYGFAPVYDRYLADELSAVNATNAAIGKGSVIPLVFNVFADPFNQMADSTNIANVVFSPFTGIPYDLMITRPCPRDPWSVSLTATVDFVTMPDDLYKVGDNLEGTKGLALINSTCTDLTPCAEA